MNQKVGAGLSRGGLLVGGYLPSNSSQLRALKICNSLTHLWLLPSIMVGAKPHSVDNAILHPHFSPQFPLYFFFTSRATSTQGGVIAIILCLPFQFTKLHAIQLHPCAPVACNTLYRRLGS
jgi:hypothetical protein